MSDTTDHAAAQTPIDMEIIECTRTTWDELHDRLAEAEARAAEQEHRADMLQSRMNAAASALDRWRAVNAVAAEGVLETVYAELMADPPADPPADPEGQP